MNQPGRNDPCCCGSGKKFKKCCLDKTPDYTELEADFALGQQRIAEHETVQALASAAENGAPIWNPFKTFVFTMQPCGNP